MCLIADISNDIAFDDNGNPKGFTKCADEDGTCMINDNSDVIHIYKYGENFHCRVIIKFLMIHNQMLKIHVGIDPLNLKHPHQVLPHHRILHHHRVQYLNKIRII